MSKRYVFAKKLDFDQKEQLLQKPLEIDQLSI